MLNPPGIWGQLPLSHTAEVLKDGTFSVGADSRGPISKRFGLLLHSNAPPPNVSQFAEVGWIPSPLAPQRGGTENFWVSGVSRSAGRNLGFLDIFLNNKRSAAPHPAMASQGWVGFVSCSHSQPGLAFGPKAGSATFGASIYMLL